MTGPQTEDKPVREMVQQVEGMSGLALSPSERLLLATDGTVTHMLEALTKQEVNVDILQRETNGGSLDRQVVLRRESDGSALVWAESEVRLFPLADEMEDALVGGDIGIGDLLRQEYEETRRQIHSMEAVWPTKGSFPDFIDGHSACYLKREYSVYSDGQRLMTIREYFPKGLF